jgi:hypothetical protein
MQQELVERARRGDHDAFASLAGGAIFRLDAAARLILRDPDQAKDAVQETLVRAWRDLPTLRSPDRFDAWLHRLLYRSAGLGALRPRFPRHDLAVSAGRGLRRDVGLHAVRCGPTRGRSSAANRRPQRPESFPPG